MGKLHECPEYSKGNAKKDFLFRNEVVFCSANICRYDKELPISIGKQPMTLCKSKGLLKKVEIQNPNTKKTKNKTYIHPNENYEGKLPRVTGFPINL